MKITLALLTFLGIGLFNSACGQAVNFGFGVSNDTSTVQEYTYTFPMPALSLAVNLPPGTYDVSATFGITLTAAPGDTAVFSLPSGTTSYMQSFINGQDAGVDVGSATEMVTDDNTEVFNFPKSTSQFVLASTGTAMSITTTFDLTPGDSASFSGSFRVSSAPEPRSLLLGLFATVAFGGLAFAARRSQPQSAGDRA